MSSSQLDSSVAFDANDRRLPKYPDSARGVCAPPACKERAPEIPELIDCIGSAIERLTDQLGRLENRLQPVMTSAPPSNPRPQREVISPMGSTLGAHLRQLELLVDATVAMRESLQV